jgi:hypothetical protein
MTPLAMLGLSMALFFGLIVGLRLHAFLAPLVGAVFVAVLTPALPSGDAPAQIATEFGAVSGRIGIIALAVVQLRSCSNVLPLHGSGQFRRRQPPRHVRDDAGADGDRPWRSSRPP